jgi:hypothetical protein
VDGSVYPSVCEALPDLRHPEKEGERGVEWRGNSTPPRHMHSAGQAARWSTGVAKMWFA